MSKRDAEPKKLKAIDKEVAALDKEARDAYTRGDYATAIENDKKSLAINPSDIGAYVSIAKAYDAAGFPDEAKANYRLAFDTPHPHVFCVIYDPMASLRYGQLAIAAKDDATARRAFVAACEGSPDVAGLHAQLDISENEPVDVLQGLALASIIDHVRPDQRLEVAQRASRLAPRSAYVTAMLALELYAMRQYKDSRSAFYKAVQLAPRDARSAITAWVDRFYELRDYSTETTVGADGKSITTRAPRKVENMAMVKPWEIRARHYMRKTTAVGQP